MLDYKVFGCFLLCILTFVIGGILIIRFARLLSHLFFTDDYYTKHFGELKPIIKVKNKKISWILSFLVPIPIAVGLYFLQLANIGGFLWYLSLYTKPKIAFYTLGSIYLVEALIFGIIILEEKLTRKTCKSKQNLGLVTLFYAILIIGLFIGIYKYMPIF